ncbi:hypothetical protein CEXT_597271 [Caerostris extrusa]|uniref:Uncharacterized protein n=1 Tax=Caerostris extrusa TaxID=172846 RepID=A0AAV4Q4S9_CAEEX|nr:hypothetical protein CEXT_597271 [Caerostris extrusa]
MNRPSIRVQIHQLGSSIFNPHNANGPVRVRHSANQPADQSLPINSQQQKGFQTRHINLFHKSEKRKETNFRIKATRMERIEKGYYSKGRQNVVARCCCVGSKGMFPKATESVGHRDKPSPNTMVTRTWDMATMCACDTYTEE